MFGPAVMNPWASITTLPVAGGLALAQLAALFSAIIAGHIGTEGPATMRYAAQVIQFPLGMIVAAVSSAILPSLSRHGDSASLDGFKGTLTQDMRLVWVLILPASVGLFVMAQPVVANMIYAPNQILSNAFVVGLNSLTGQFRIFAERTLDAIVDVSGYFAP